ncbi:MAG: 23S rRNA (uracil(1939)-C(5))-methyltransferase RlmD [Candidatus Acidiferrales bacterium]
MDVKIEKLIYGGDGLAHHEGATVFVPFVLPDETVVVVPTENKKKFVRGRLESVLTPSPERIAADCPHFITCGGCHYQHIPYEAQLRYKEQILRETLRRIGKIDWTGPIVAHASPPWGYRNRAQWKVRETGLDDAPQIGYFQANSTSIVPIETCPILSPRLLATFEAVRELLASGGLPASLREVEAFADERDESVLLTLSYGKFPKAPAETQQLLRETIPTLSSVLFQDVSQQRMDLKGPGSLTYSVGEFQYRVSHLSFFQVNRILVGELAQAVAEAAGSGELAYDIYAGVGLFSLPLSRQFRRVIGAESNPVAAHDFKANFGVPANRATGKLEIRETDAVDFLRGVRQKPNCVVLDPPRAGLGSEGTAALRKLGPATIVYVSCEPSTLARDLEVFVAQGYAVSVVHIFDLFPQTFHIESMVKLVKK